MGMKVFGKRKLERESQSISRRSSELDGYGVSQSTSEHKDYIVEPHELNAFPPGQFLAKLVSTEKTFYKGRVKYVEEKIDDIPPFRNPQEVTEEKIKANYDNIKKVCRELVDSYAPIESDDNTSISRKMN